MCMYIVPEKKCSYLYFPPIEGEHFSYIDVFFPYLTSKISSAKVEFSRNKCEIMKKRWSFLSPIFKWLKFSATMFVYAELYCLHLLINGYKADCVAVLCLNLFPSQVAMSMCYFTGCDFA